MLKYIILLLSLTSIAAYDCPTPNTIQAVVDFQEVVEQQPFPQYPGVSIFNGVTYQQKGICSQTGELCTHSISCPNQQDCRLLSKELLFNLIPSNIHTQLNPQDITYTVRTAKKIVLTGYITPPPYIPNILCTYNVSQLQTNYSCLPKFCNNYPCMISNNTCNCIPEPCQLYYAVEI